MFRTITAIVGGVIHIFYASFSFLVSTIFAFLPTTIQLYVRFYRDATISLFRVIFGRALPDLSLPDVDLSGQTAIVTGANSGIGLQIASDLARQGCRVFLACRSRVRAEAAVRTILWRVPGAKGRVGCLELDTSDLDSVRECAVRWSMGEDKRIDVLVLNAGIAAPGGEGGGLGLTEDGIEVVYATNFLGGFLLTHFLEPYLTPKARVVLTSSAGQYLSKFTGDFSVGPVRGVCESGFHCGAWNLGRGWRIVGDDYGRRYANTKAMQVCFAKRLQRRFDALAKSRGDGARRLAHAFSPGFTSTTILGKIGSGNFWELLTGLAIDVDQGAVTGSWLAMSEVVDKGAGGEFWERQTRQTSVADILSERMMDRFWMRWEKDCGIEW